MNNLRWKVAAVHGQHSETSQGVALTMPPRWSRVIYKDSVSTPQRRTQTGDARLPKQNLLGGS